MKEHRLEVCWDDRFMKELNTVYSWMRMMPGIGDCSTPELMALAMKGERALFEEFVLGIYRAMARTERPVLDCEVLGALEGLREKVAKGEGS